MEQLRLPEPPDSPYAPRPRRLLVTIPEAASVLAIGRSTVYELIARGQLEALHIGRTTRVPVDILEDFVERMRHLPAGDSLR